MVTVLCKRYDLLLVVSRLRLRRSLVLAPLGAAALSTPAIAGYGYASLFGGTAVLLAIMTAAATLAGSARWLRRR